MPRYRFAINASLMLSVDAKDETEAEKKADASIQEMMDGECGISLHQGSSLDARCYPDLDADLYLEDTSENYDDGRRD